MILKQIYDLFLCSIFYSAILGYKFKTYFIFLFPLLQLL